MRVLLVCLYVECLLAATVPASAAWTNITYSSLTAKANINGGSGTGGGSYNTGPADPVTSWTDNFSFGGPGTRIWSANNIEFSDTKWDTGGYYGAASSHLIIKLNLSQWIWAFNWEPQDGYGYVKPGNAYEWKYSTDGVHWSLVTFMNGRHEVDGVQKPNSPPSWGGGNYDPGTHFVNCGDTNTLYLGYFGTVNGEGNAAFNEQHFVSEPGIPMSFWVSSTPEPGILVMLALNCLVILRRYKQG